MRTSASVAPEEQRAGVGLTVDTEILVGLGFRGLRFRGLGFRCLGFGGLGVQA